MLKIKQMVLGWIARLKKKDVTIDCNMGKGPITIPSGVKVKGLILTGSDVTKIPKDLTVVPDGTEPVTKIPSDITDKNLLLAYVEVEHLHLYNSDITEIPPNLKVK